MVARLNGGFAWEFPHILITSTLTKVKGGIDTMVVLFCPG
jgi:hypothetical protein